MKMWALAVAVASLAVPALAQGPGADTYKAKCAMCHGPDGLATTPVAKMMNVPSFKAPAVARMTKAELIEVVTNGKAKMPAYKGKLTDAQIEQVVAYIKSLEK
jgi:mono/diheme cytochrome c family protein